jgi:ABC-type polysaccharide/polyol phosphate transport system ATPase subunit
MEVSQQRSQANSNSAASAIANAIEVDHLTKDFRVYHRTFSSLKSMAMHAVTRFIKRSGKPGFEIRRVLNDLTFDIKQGETVALLGRNGSGKSTLLSILSRIYLPTSGEARIYGRVMSLLELGAGFHQELTGMDNLRFQAAMLGFPDDELKHRLERIISFSELDPTVLDLPVRMYSSGMQLRLAFSTAINLDAEILLVDEALAVGDQGFQDKCIAKMSELQEQGKTIVMVTHGLDQLKSFAHRALWLEKGKIIADGDPDSIVSEYRAMFKHESDRK